MSLVHSLKLAVATVTLAAFLAPSISIAPAQAQAAKPAVVKKADQKVAKKKCSYAPCKVDSPQNHGFIDIFRQMICLIEQSRDFRTEPLAKHG